MEVIRTTELMARLDLFSKTKDQGSQPRWKCEAKATPRIIYSVAVIAVLLTRIYGSATCITNWMNKFCGTTQASSIAFVTTRDATPQVTSSHSHVIHRLRTTSIRLTLWHIS